MCAAVLVGMALFKLGNMTTDVYESTIAWLEKAVEEKKSKRRKRSSEEEEDHDDARGRSFALYLEQKG